MRHDREALDAAGGALGACSGCAAACGGGDGDRARSRRRRAAFQVLAGGNNVPDRYSSDLWVHGAWAYTGTWGGTPRNGARGDVLKIWSLDAAGAPTLVDSIKRARASAP